MERYICPVLNKKICPYSNVESFYADERCTKCTIPEVYMGINPKVPESHCEAGTKNIIGDGIKNPKTEKLYNYLMKNSKEFRNLSMDRQGEVLMEMFNCI